MVSEARSGPADPADRGSTAAGADPGSDQGIDQGVEQGIDQGVDQSVDQGIDQGVDQSIDQGDDQGIDQGPEGGTDPDYRFTLANERTFLAWFRTALALIAGAVAVVQLIPQFAFPGARHALGLALSLMGGAVALVAVRRWHRVQRAMRRDEDLPPTRMPALLGCSLAVITAFVVVLIVLSSERP